MIFHRINLSVFSVTKAINLPREERVTHYNDENFKDGKRLGRLHLLKPSSWRFLLSSQSAAFRAKRQESPVRNRQKDSQGSAIRRRYFHFL